MRRHGMRSPDRAVFAAAAATAALAAIGLTAGCSAAGDDRAAPAAQFAEIAQAPQTPVQSFAPPQPAATTQSIPPRPAAPSTEWSGQPGASGHPEMTVERIRASAANFRTCIAGLWPLAARRGVSRANFDAYTAALTPELQDHGFHRRPAGIHQVVLGLSRPSRDRQPHRAKAAKSSLHIAPCSTRWRRLTASIAISSRRSGASN